MRGKARLALAAMIVFAATALPAVPGAAAGTPRVLVVGDSLTELAAPYLPRNLPGVEVTVDAVGGYNSFQVKDLFDRSYDPSYSVVVFDGGTNDNPNYPEILAGNLGEVAATVGGRCMVVPTVHGFTVEGVGNEGKNRVVREFAASRPGTQTPDWAGAVATHPELMQADNLHPIAAGAELRARLIADGVLGCLAYAEAPVEKVELRPRPELETVSRFRRRERRLFAAAGSALALRLMLGAGPAALPATTPGPDADA